MHCPHFKKFETHMCVSAESAIIPSISHREEFCTTKMYWACPYRRRLSEVAAAFSYGI